MDSKFILSEPFCVLNLSGTSGLENLGSSEFFFVFCFLILGSPYVEANFFVSIKHKKRLYLISNWRNFYWIFKFLLFFYLIFKETKHYNRCQAVVAIIIFSFFFFALLPSFWSFLCLFLVINNSSYSLHAILYKYLYFIKFESVYVLKFYFTFLSLLFSFDLFLLNTF